MTDVRTRAVLVTAVLIGAFLLVQQVIGNIAGLAYAPTQPAYLGAQVGATFYEVFTRDLPVAIGVFLVFWRFLAPITADLSVQRVIIRSLVASAAGTVFALVVGLVAGFAAAFPGYLFGNSFPFRDVGDTFQQFVNLIVSAITGYVGLVPLVALAAVLLWIWLRGRSA